MSVPQTRWTCARCGAQGWWTPSTHIGPSPWLDHATPAGRSCAPASDGKIVIVYNVRRCEGMPGHGGWLPSVTVNGREVCYTWAARPLDEPEAWEAAQARAEREASRYVGDWSIEIRRG